MHNAPFEQTFRVTVYLPLGQLYVTRIGAKTKLSELLQIICINKLLDSKKFEFRHPSKYTYIHIYRLYNIVHIMYSSDGYVSMFYHAFWRAVHPEWDCTLMC